MLPARLCEDLCSLNSNQDKCAFSAIWQMDPEGNIVDEWFGKTVIKNCSKMSYDIAQLMLEGKITNTFETVEEELLKVSDLGPFCGHSVQDLVHDVKLLSELAEKLRNRRYQVLWIHIVSFLLLLFINFSKERNFDLQSIQTRICS